MTTLEIDPLAKELGDRFQAAGHELYLVGGVVRDLVIGRLTPVTTSTSRPTPRRRRPRVCSAAGRRPSTWSACGSGRWGRAATARLVEITTFREERYPEDERKPAVTFAKDIQTDLSRRDFTINAMAVRLPDGEFVDPFEGVKDLAAKRLDTPLDPEVAFSDDPLRMLRAARFVSQFGVTPVPRVVEAIARMRERLRIVSAERIREELDKLLLARVARCRAGVAGRDGARGGVPARAAGAPARAGPGPPSQGRPAAHVRGRRASASPIRSFAWRRLLHDIGKPSTREITPDGVPFHHHEVVGARMAEERLRELRYPNARRRGRAEARRAAPPVPWLRRGLDGRRGAPLRARRRAAARQAEPAHARGLHHP